MHESSKTNVQNAIEVINSAMRNLPNRSELNLSASALTATGLYATSMLNELGRIADALEGNKPEPVDLPPLKGMSDEANMAWAEYRNDYGVDPTDANHRAFHAGFKAGESNLIAQTSAMQNEIDDLSRQSQEWLDAYVSAYNNAESVGLDLADARYQIDQLKSELENQTARADAAEKMMFYCNMDASEQSIMKSGIRRDIESLMKSPEGRSREFILDELRRILVKDRGREFDARVRKAARR